MSIEGVPCGDPHDAQAYDEFFLRGGTSPGMAEVGTDAADGCIDRWPAAMESSWESDRVYDVFYLTPTQEGWQLGDHEVTCFVVRIEGEAITGDLL